MAINVIRITSVSSIWLNSKKPSITIWVGLIKVEMNDVIIGTHAITDTGSTPHNNKCINIVLYIAIE